MTELSGDELARACAAAMYANDRASRGVGISIAEVRTGYARLSLTITPEMLNGFGICHGGFIFTLADTAFACACNSRNDVNLAQKCTIEYKRPGRPGDRLTASAEHLYQDGRYGHYQVRITDQDDNIIALFEGRSCRVRGRVIDVLTDAGQGDNRKARYPSLPVSVSDGLTPPTLPQGEGD